MNSKVNFALALFAGFAGGILTRYIAPQPAFAQSQRPTKEIHAQTFTLVNSSDRAVGTFGVWPLPGSDGRIYGIVLEDPSGHVLWSAGGKGGDHSLRSRLGLGAG
jgi:hypothetical protein